MISVSNIHLALNGIASQPHSTRPASRANDGIPNINWLSNSCASTGDSADIDAWWKLDMLEEKKVFMVRLTTRGSRY